MRGFVAQLKWYFFITPITLRNTNLEKLGPVEVAIPRGIRKHRQQRRLTAVWLSIVTWRFQQSEPLNACNLPNLTMVF